MRRGVPIIYTLWVAGGDGYEYQMEIIIRHFYQESKNK